MTKAERVELIELYLRVMRLPTFVDGRETLDYEGFDKGVERILKLARGGTLWEEWEDDVPALRQRLAQQ